MITEIPTTTSLSGGELPQEERADYLRLRALIQKEDDVHAVHGLSYLDDEGRWLYLIETPFATWPRYVVGTTDGENLNPEPSVRCGHLETARQAFDELNFGSYA
jgi:hypothetical protein